MEFIIFSALHCLLFISATASPILHAILDVIESLNTNFGGLVKKSIANKTNAKKIFRPDSIIKKDKEIADNSGFIITTVYSV